VPRRLQGLVNLDALTVIFRQSEERGQPVVFRCDREPEPHVRKLMRTLGVRVEVQPVSPARSTARSSERARTMPKTAAEWSVNDAITAIRLWAEAHDGEPPKMEEWRKLAPEHPSYAVLAQLFGSWNDGIAAAGFEPRPSSRQAPGAQPEVQFDGSDSSTSSEVAKQEAASEPGQAEVAERKKRPHGYWTRERMIERIQRWHAETGAPPLSTEWFAPGGDWPAVSAVRKTFGSWANAIREAGYEPGRGGVKKGQKLGREPQGREAAVSLLAGPPPADAPKGVSPPAPAVLSDSPRPAVTEPRSRPDTPPPGLSRALIAAARAFLDTLERELADG